MQRAICNVHFHHLTAKRDSGFGKSHDDFWGELATTLKDTGSRILAGDFNMSIFKVVPALREHGLIVDMVAWFPWLKNDGTLKLDSCGIFVVGGAARISLYNTLRVFETSQATQENSRGSGLSSLTAIAEEKASASESGSEVSVEEQPKQPEPERLSRFNAGAGYDLTCYLPKKKQLEAVRASLTRSALQKDDPSLNLLPHCKEKRCDAKMFDPNQMLFRAGAHMPLIVFVGEKSRRTDEALEIPGKTERQRKRKRKRRQTKQRKIDSKCGDDCKFVCRCGSGCGRCVNTPKHCSKIQGGRNKQRIKIRGCGHS